MPKYLSVKSVELIFETEIVAPDLEVAKQVSHERDSEIETQLAHTQFPIGTVLTVLNDAELNYVRLLDPEYVEDEEEPQGDLK